MIKVSLTAAQKKTLAPLFKDIEALNCKGVRCAIVAQVYKDGLLVKLLKGKEVTALARALGGGDGEHNSAAARLRELQGVAHDS